MTMNPYLLLATCAVMIGGVASGDECPMDFWGVSCDALCNCLYNSQCDRGTGVCLAGCAKGWKSENDKYKPCDTRECSVGKFGPPTCKGECHCVAGEDCNAVDGECESLECENGFWGPNCQENVTECDVCNITDANCVPCSMNSCWCEDPDCDLPKGQCRSNKCPAGFKGPECQERACDVGFFGPPECKFQCHCFDAASCNVVDGKCPDDHCEKGWQGQTCSNPGCPAMRFGYPECDQNCFCLGSVEDAGAEDDEAVRCDDRSGQCPKGCVAGWSGRTCSDRTPCPDGFWGKPNCTRQCHCEDNSGCNAQTGKCEFGKCQNGWGHYLCDASMRTPWEQSSEDSEKSGTGMKVFGAASVLCVALAVAGGVTNFMSSKKETTNKEEEIEMGEHFLKNETQQPGPSEQT